jgi:hypothetical protein
MTMRRGADSQSACAGWRAGATLLLALLAACAHKPPPPTPIPPPAVPRAAVDAMCGRLKSEGVNGEMRALKMTQPLVTPESVMALAEAMSYSGHAKPQISVPASVPVETSGSCVTRALDSVGPRDSDVMVAAFSSPLENPFARGTLGVFARVTLGGEAATWYWIPIGPRGGTWAAASPIMLALRD